MNFIPYNPANIANTCETNKLNRINHFEILKFIFGKVPISHIKKSEKVPLTSSIQLIYCINVKQAPRRGSPASIMSCPEDYLFSIHFCSKMLSCLLVL